METSDEEFVSDLPDEASAKPGEDALKRLRERLKKVVEEKQEYLEGWQRSRADFANYKKEEARAHAELQVRQIDALLQELLPALDALELANKHLPAQAGEENATLKMIEKQFIDALKKLGIERFGAVGEEFDPRRHEALAKNTEEHIVTAVARSGYQLNDHIIRPAQVII